MKTEPDIIIIDEISQGEARKRIVDYLEEHDLVYPSELSENLHIDYDLVWEIIGELDEEGIIEPGD